VTGDGLPVTGHFTPNLFRVTDTGRLVARGTLNLLVGGDTPQRLSKAVSIPVRSATSTAAAPSLTTNGLTTAALAPGACQILNLVLGPLHLDLLGLVIDLNRVVLNIVAQSGAGNLLGNLLCAVAGLLDGTSLSGLSTQLAALLNALLAILNQP